MIGRLPSGTITFLFTDIEGSTRLWGADPERMRPALARHDALLADAIAAHGGHLFKHTGDGVCAAFASAPAALAAAIAAQRALGAEPWGDLPALRARMALHTGEAQAQGQDYQGMALNRVARLMAAGHGGQLLLSQASAVLLQDALPADLALRDLGTHRLKDLQQPERIFQVAGLGLLADFPPLRSLDARPNNLPAQATSFVGREGELTAVGALLDGARLVTLTGAGGTGKTRLALQAAAGRLEHYRDGVWLVELAALRDPALVPQAAAQALRLHIPADRTPQDALLAHLANKELLLILDNCEHLLAGCADLAATLLRACPQLRLLATSRERLRVAGEALYSVPPLGLPGREREPLGALTAYAAVQLFLDRALSVQPSFQVTNANAPALAQTCAYLEGIPLAIELAAARLRSLSLEALAERLGDRFRLLTGGGRGELPHHQTLRAAIDWSHDLLSPAEQTLFRRLAVFAGGWSLDGAEAICAGDDLDALDVFDLLDSLVDKSLVLAEPDAEGAVRYRMLETVREYAADKLDAAGETMALRDRHYTWFLDQAMIAHEVIWRGITDAVAERRSMRQIHADQDNSRAALAHGGKDTTAFALAAALNLVSYPESRAWLQRLLAGGKGKDVRADAMTLYSLAGVSPTLTENVRIAEEAIALFRQLDDPFSLAHALVYQSTLTASLGETERAHASLEECKTLARQHDEPRLLLEALQAEASPAMVAADGVHARPPLEEALALARKTASPRRVGSILTALAHACYLAGDYSAATSHAEEAIQIAISLGDRAVNPYRWLGDTRRAQGRFAEARTAYLSSFADFWLTANVPMAYCALARLGALAAAEGDFPRAVRYIAAAEHMRAEDGFQLPPIEAREIEPALAAAQAALPPEEYQAAWEAGQALDMKTALAHCRMEEEALAIASLEKGQP